MLSFLVLRTARRHLCHELSGLAGKKGVQRLSSSVSFSSGYSRACSNHDDRHGLAEHCHRVWG
jgi:hypothetical protein